MGKNKKKANVDEAKEALISDKKAGELMDLASSDDKDIEQTNKHSLERSKVSYSKRAESENGSVKDKLINQCQKDVKSNNKGSPNFSDMN